MTFKTFSVAIVALSVAAPSSAAVFNVAGNLHYERSAVLLAGEVEADLEGLDPSVRQRYRAAAKLVLPNGFEIVPVVENTSGIGPVEVRPSVEVDRSITLFDVARETPPFRVNALLDFDLGPFTIGQGLLGAFDFLSDNPFGSETFGGVTFGWDVQGVSVTPQTLTGPFEFSARGDVVGDALDDLALFLGEDLVGPLLRQLNSQGDLPAICANNPAACANALRIVGVDAFSADYELHLSLQPLALVPVPAGLPLIATGLAALAALRRGRARA